MPLQEMVKVIKRGIRSVLTHKKRHKISTSSINQASWNGTTQSQSQTESGLHRQRATQVRACNGPQSPQHAPHLDFCYSFPEPGQLAGNVGSRPSPPTSGPFRHGIADSAKEEEEDRGDAQIPFCGICCECLTRRKRRRQRWKMKGGMPVRHQGGSA